MSRSRSFDERDLPLYAAEAGRMYEDGSALKDIANSFKWKLADVKKLTKLPEFLDKLSDEKRAEFLIESESGVREALDFAIGNLLEYVEMMDKLARTANSEQVRYNALDKLMGMAKLEMAAKTFETVQLEEGAEQRLKQALVEAFGGSLESE